MRYFLFLFVVILSISSTAQDETLISGKETGGFGGPVLKFTSIKNQAALMFGGRGGWIFNHSLIIGGGIYGTLTEVDAPEGALQDEGPLDIELEYFGAEVEYVFHPMELLHYSFYAFIGGATVRFVKDKGSVFESKEQSGETDLGFLFEPAINGELNFTTWFRVGVGISYRIVTGISQPKLKSNDFSNFAASLSLKFGSF